MQPYRIVVPSRKRTFLIMELLARVPVATVVVDQKEAPAYLKVGVPPAQLVTHPSLTNLPLIRNFMMEHFEEPVLIFMDDDFQAIKILGGHGGWLKTWPDIQRMLENGIEIAHDLGVGVYCWNTFPACSKDYQSSDPLSVTATPIGTFIVMGSARHRHFDPQAVGRADIDFGLQTLLHDRILLCDKRYYMFHGLKEHLPGGASGLINDAVREASTNYMRKKWGTSVIPPWSPSKVGSRMRFGVNRRRGK